MNAQLSKFECAEASHFNATLMMDIMHSAMLEINERHFGSNVIQHKDRKPDATLTYLRKASKKQSKGFFNIAKSPCLMPTPPNRTYPPGKEVADFMEKCPGLLAPEPHPLKTYNSTAKFPQSQ